MKPKIYTASKVFRAPMWRALRIDYPDIEFTSSWINEDITPLIDADETKCQEGWINNIQDVARSDHLICYAEHDDELSGTLVEIGAMLLKAASQMGKHSWVYLVGDCKRFSTWQHHPNVIIADTVPNQLAPQFRVACVLDRIQLRGK